jgi:hypothetical protein
MPSQLGISRWLAIFPDSSWSRHERTVVTSLGGMDDPEIDLRLDPPGTGSRSVTYGDIFKIRPNLFMVNTFSPFYPCVTA